MKYQGLMYSLTNEVLDSSKVNMPIAEAKPKTETIIKDIQLKQLDPIESLKLIWII